ncbi:MAG: hypothetical protein QW270_01225 [Candidatus Bathyarchaeia archaeon]
MNLKHLLVFTMLAFLLAAVVEANPIPIGEVMIQGEDITAWIYWGHGALWAEVNGIYKFSSVDPAETVIMYYPVPNDTRNISVKMDGNPVTWVWNGTYYHITVDRWFSTDFPYMKWYVHPTETFTVTTHYEHSVPNPYYGETYAFLYAYGSYETMGWAKHCPANITVYISKRVAWQKDDFAVYLVHRPSGDLERVFPRIAQIGEWWQLFYKEEDTTGTKDFLVTIKKRPHGCLRLETDKAKYVIGENVIIRVKNIGDVTVAFPNVQKIRIVGPLPSTNEVWPGIYLPAITFLSPGQQVVYVWDQKDWQGNQVPEGVYVVQTVTMPGQLPQEPFVYFSTWYVSSPTPPDVDVKAVWMKTDQAEYRPGCNVTISLTIVGTLPVQFLCAPPISIIDENGNEVWPIIHLHVVWSENPCTTLTYVWDQRDAQSGLPVPRGVYKVVVHCENLTCSDILGSPFICFRIGLRPVGDLNDDGTAGSVDLGVIYGALGSSNLLCDLNGDGKVNYQDFGLECGFYLGWQTRYYTYAPPIEGTATVFGLVILEIARDYP